MKKWLKQFRSFKFVVIWKWLHAFRFVVLLLFALLSGCEKKSPVAISVIMDSTASTTQGRDEFVKELKRLIKAGYFPKGTQAAFISSCDRPKLAWAGDITQGLAVKNALEEITSACPVPLHAKSANTGSNPAAALKSAKVWLMKPEFKTNRRIILMYSDLKNDADQTRQPPRKFPDPKKFNWTGLEETEIYVYGLPFGQHEIFQKEWKHQKLHMSFHQPREMLSAKALKLHSSTF